MPLRSRALTQPAPRSWVGANDWTGRPKCDVALSLDAPAVLARITALLSKA